MSYNFGTPGKFFEQGKNPVLANVPKKQVEPSSPPVEEE